MSIKVDEHIYYKLHNKYKKNKQSKVNKQIISVTKI